MNFARLVNHLKRVSSGGFWQDKLSSAEDTFFEDLKCPFTVHQKAELIKYSTIFLSVFSSKIHCFQNVSGHYLSFYAETR